MMMGLFTLFSRTILARSASLLGPDRQGGSPRTRACTRPCVLRREHHRAPLLPLSSSFGIIMLIPVTKMIVGKSTARLRPAVPLPRHPRALLARLVETNLLAVDPGKIEVSPDDGCLQPSDPLGCSHSRGHAGLIQSTSPPWRSPWDRLLPAMVGGAPSAAAAWARWPSTTATTAGRTTSRFHRRRHHHHRADHSSRSAILALGRPPRALTDPGQGHPGLRPSIHSVRRRKEKHHVVTVSQLSAWRPLPPWAQ